MSCCCLIWAAADWMKCVCLDIFLAFLKRSCVCITSITYIRQIYETGQTNLHPLSFSSSSSCSLILFGFGGFSASTRCAWGWATHVHRKHALSARLETRLTTGFQVRSMTDTQQKHTAPLYNVSPWAWPGLDAPQLILILSPYPPLFWVDCLSDRSVNTVSGFVVLFLLPACSFRSLLR